MLAILTITPAATTFLVLILLILLIFSFLFSGSEMALFSLTVRDINMLKTRQQPSYKRIVTLLENPKILLTSLLISNCLVNIGIILISNLLMNEWIDSLGLQDFLNMIIKVIVIAGIIVMFCEVLPRVWAIHHKIWFASTASMTVEIFHTIFFKFSKRLVALSDSIEKNFHSGSKNRGDNTQLDYAIDSLPDNSSSNEKKQILRGIKKFGNTTVKQTMRTRLDVTGIEISSSFENVIKKIKEVSHSRLPVYKNDLDEIAGMLHTKDLLPHLQDIEFDWHSLMRPVFYVHEQKLIEDLLQDFRNRRNHFAVVVDEFGGTSGIITLEDIMEEIIGDINDEFDDEQNINKKIDENNYIFEGKTMIFDVCKILNIPTHTFDKLRGESDSLAGLVLEMAGEFPKVNETFETKNYIFTPIEINKNRIEKVKLTLKSKEGK
ncbi:MAG TPA: gliding motility-associated protein GldE [Hanamia sp.]|nr:gliding motility-associated protein GldE [Hanamia sp.]